MILQKKAGVQAHRPFSFPVVTGGWLVLAGWRRNCDGGRGGG